MNYYRKTKQYVDIPNDCENSDIFEFKADIDPVWQLVRFRFMIEKQVDKMRITKLISPDGNQSIIFFYPVNLELKEGSFFEEWEYENAVAFSIYFEDTIVEYNPSEGNKAPGEPTFNVLSRIALNTLKEVMPDKTEHLIAISDEISFTIIDTQSYVKHVIANNKEQSGGYQYYMCRSNNNSALLLSHVNMDKINDDDYLESMFNKILNI